MGGCAGLLEQRPFIAEENAMFWIAIIAAFAAIFGGLAMFA